ncbi:phage structural protein [Gallibacterium anatis]|uniref:phage structural protein n=1 Tax=Gallibacterium anatis TaxID=750 RepID=UPI0038B4151C
MAALATYAPDEVSIVIGAAIATGFADGTFIDIEEISDGVTSVAGADGEVARTTSADPRKKITLTLMQTSSTNDVLSALYAADKVSKNATFPIAVKDLRGRSLFAASTAWITKSAKLEFGKEIGSREWVIETADGTLTVGGND